MSYGLENMVHIELILYYPAGEEKKENFKSTQMTDNILLSKTHFSQYFLPMPKWENQQCTT